MKTKKEGNTKNLVKNETEAHTEKVIYSLLTEMETIGCFELKATNNERKMIAKTIIKNVESGSDDFWIGSERWL